jgi:hypothetical protein
MDAGALDRIEAPGRLFHIAMDAGAFPPLGAIPALASIWTPPAVSSNVLCTGER